MAEELIFRLDADLPEALDLDLRWVLGTCQTGKLWDGRRYFDLPAPYEHVRVVDRDRIRGQRRAELLEALRFFGCMEGGDRCWS
jgi:hypothetical protein